MKIADDPVISDQPFVEASDVYAKVELIPLLSRRIHVTQVTLKNPEVRIIRTEQGNLNVSTIGKRSEAEKAPPPTPEETRRGAIKGAPITAEQGTAKKPSLDLAALYVRAFSIDNGHIVYDERGPKHQTITIQDVDLTVERFSFNKPFDINLKLAAFSEKQNVEISGSAGPLASEGKIDVKSAPFKIKAKLGPILLARLRAIGALGKAIPEKLSMPDPVTISATAAGKLDTIDFHVDSDLSGDRVAWGDAFDKPASVTLKLSADGSKAGSEIRIGKAKVKLGDLDATASKIALRDGNVSARVDTNRFDIASLSKIVGALQKYNASGQGEIHLDAAVANKQPSATGTITLAKVSVARPGDKNTLVNNLSGDIKLQGRAADAGPLKFDLGSGHATLTVHAKSLQPVQAQYDLTMDSVKVAEFVTSRPPEEHLSNLAVNGNVAQGDELAVSANASSSDGNLVNVVYKGLAAAVTMQGKQVNIQSLKLNAFNGNVAASGQATLGDQPQFALNLGANNIDLQQALQSQKAKVADTIRGALTGQVQVSGAGSKFDQIKPTLKGNGRATIANGKLIGINVAAEALKKVQNLPQIGDLVPASVVQRHPELFSNPDTDLRSASLSFLLQGPRITTHDLLVQTQDYSLTGDGWFDMDKNIEMLVRLLLTPQLTQEIIAEKKNVVYVTNKQGQVDVPARVTGKLPKPSVMPDVQELAQRAGQQLLQEQGKKAIGKFLGKKGIPGVPFLGGTDGGGGAAPSGKATPQPAPASPFDQFKKFIH